MVDLSFYNLKLTILLYLENKKIHLFICLFTIRIVNHGIM